MYIYTENVYASENVRYCSDMNTPHNQQKTVAEQLDAARLLRMKEVEHWTGLKRSALYARIRAGSFPPPHSLSGRCSRWRADQVAIWVEKAGASA